jgi:cytochrome d ubiquinol oxidase subunit II
MEVSWFILVLSFLMIYILMDGGDLGIGILTLFENDKDRKFEEIELVANVWDANETWIVMTGVALWGGFPVIYGSVLQFLYPLVFTMLFGLILRGFSTEMISSRGEDIPKKWYWLFGLGSLIAALAQGSALGSLTSKIVMKNEVVQLGALGKEVINNTTNASPAGSFFSWFTVLFAFVVVAAYLCLGFASLKFHWIQPELNGKRGIIATITLVVLLVIAFITINFTAAPLNFKDDWRIAAFVSFAVVALVGVGYAIYNFQNQRKTFHAQGGAMIGICLAAVAAALAFTVTHYPVFVPGGVDLDANFSSTSTYHFYLVGVGLWIPLMWYFLWFAHRALIKRGKNGLWQSIGLIGGSKK